MWERIGTPELIISIVMLTMSLVVIWPAGRICRRLGFSPWLGVMAVIPLANLLLLWFVAMAPWPAADSRRGV
jgi:hypothetical protein